MLKEHFISVVSGKPARVLTSDFIREPAGGTGNLADWVYQYEKLEMRLRVGGAYDIYGHRYHATYESLLYKDVDMTCALETLRGFQKKRMATSPFNPDGADSSSPYGGIWTRQDVLDARDKDHIDFVGPRFGLNPLPVTQPVSAARLMRLRKARAG